MSGSLDLTDATFLGDGFRRIFAGASGDVFTIFGNEGGGRPLVAVGDGCTSGEQICSLLIFNASTISGLTLIPGVYAFTLPSDSIVLNIGGVSADVPLPAALPMMSAAMGLPGGLRRRPS